MITKNISCTQIVTILLFFERISVTFDSCQYWLKCSVEAVKLVFLIFKFAWSMSHLCLQKLAYLVEAAFLSSDLVVRQTDRLKYCTLCPGNYNYHIPDSYRPHYCRQYWQLYTPPLIMYSCVNQRTMFWFAIKDMILELMDWKQLPIQCYFLFMVACVPFLAYLYLLAHSLELEN